jgi:Protein of unknown function (DUF2380)
MRARVVLFAARLLAAVGAAVAGPARAEDPAPPPRIPIAVIDFDYRDTSGETSDQTAEHRARMSAFMDKLRSDIAARAGFRLVALPCKDPPCTAGNIPAPVLIDTAKSAGARLILYGEVHKMSTLIEWGKLQIVDLQADKLIYDKMLTFRGDTDEAWARAEAFIAEELRSREFAP